MRDNLARVVYTQDTVLLGRRTYDLWAPYWPTSDNEPFASFINGVTERVATSTPLETPWDAASIIDGAIDDFVRDLKTQPGADIGVHGSISLARSLLTANLVDELHLVVTPAVAGTGRRLFEETDQRRRLELLRGTTTPSGALLVDYRISEHVVT